MKTLSFIVLIIQILVAARAGADGWPAATRSLVREYNQTRPSPFDLVHGNGFLISLTDHLELQLRGWGAPVAGARTISVLGTTGEFREPTGTRRALDLSYWPASAAAPLAVYLPGIFQGVGDDDTHRMVDLLRRAGYRVLVIPDPLGFEYMANDPVAPPASYVAEARIVRAAVAEVLAREGGTRARVIAASHGAFLAAVTWSLDQNADQPLFEDVSLLFPQADLGRAMELIDGHITTRMRVDPPRALIGSVFRGALSRLVRRLQRTFVRDAASDFKARTYAPEAERGLRTYRRSVDAATLTFRRVLEEYVARPEVLAQFGGEDGRLVTWLARGHAARGATNIRLIVGADDWTNAADAWATLPDWLRAGHRFVTIERAGHAGLVAAAWFREAILAAMTR